MWLEASALKEKQPMPGDQDGTMYKGKINKKKNLLPLFFHLSILPYAKHNCKTNDKGFLKIQFMESDHQFHRAKKEKGKKGIWGQKGPGSITSYLTLLESSLLIFQPFPVLLFNVIQRIFISLELSTNYFLCYCIWEQKLYLLS